MACPGLPATPETEPILTILPYRPRIMGREAARHAVKTERRLTLITSSKSSSLIRRISPSRVIPALLTRISSLPAVSAIFSTVSPSAFLSPRSQVWNSADPPAALISSTRLSSASAERASPKTWCPSAARRRAMPRPMPRLAPVTMASRFSIGGSRVLREVAPAGWKTRPASLPDGLDCNVLVLGDSVPEISFHRG